MNNRSSQIAPMLRKTIIPGPHFLILAGLYLFLAGQVILAQESISKEVIVVKPYQPTLSDAIKINILPAINDTISIRPDVRYVIHPKKIDAELEVKPIKAANLVGGPLDKLYKAYLKLGIGNYLTPLAELNVNTTRSKNNSFGLYLKHYSINGKVKLENEEKVPPGYNENRINLYGKKIFRKSELYGNLATDYYGINFYGYNPDTIVILEKDDVRQHYIFTTARVGLLSTYMDSSHLNYNVFLNYGLTYDKYSNYEHAFKFSGDFNKKFSNHVFGIKAGFAHYLLAETIDSVSNTVIKINPWFARTTPEYSYMLGVDFPFDISGEKISVPVHPMAYLQIKVIDKIMVPYFGIEGNLRENNFGVIARENMYIIPGLHIRNTNQKITGYLGVRGFYSSLASYNLKIDYSIVDDMYYFVNDTNDLLGNRFLAVYDNIEYIHLMGEFALHYNDKLQVRLKGDYFKYNMNNLEHPWHKPAFEMMLNTRYDLRNKIIFEGDVFYVGKRYAYQPVSMGGPVELKGYLDLNIGLEYRYTKILSAFLKLNNLFGFQQEPWLFYPGMRFNLMLGFTYAM